MKIIVVGIGYVGLANAVLFSYNHDVLILDINKDKVDAVNNRKCPFKDELITNALINDPLHLKAALVKEGIFKDADIIFIATPTNYDDEMNYFDTSSVTSTIEQIVKENADSIIVIKSTVPVGYTKEISNKLNITNLYFSPEFLREGKALFDVLNPNRIIVGYTSLNDDRTKNAKTIINLMSESIVKQNVKCLLMGTTEAEASKLFANTFLAMRVAYFNELDTYAETKGLNTKDIIDGVSLDPRIGDFYNNPSFGYGGYCLPKDTKQLKANFIDIPNQIITATVQANETRMNFIANRIIEKVSDIKNPTIGVYGLAMKWGSDNFRNSSVISIMEIIKSKGFNVEIYDPTIEEDKFNETKVEKDLSKFKKDVHIVIANRYDNNLDDIKEKVYTRDIYERE